MTTHYIEQLGVEKCREILSGAPEWAVTFNIWWCIKKYAKKKQVEF